MELKDIEKKILELREKGYGKTDLVGELELALYEELHEIMGSNVSPLKYVGTDLNYRAECLLEHIFEDHFDKSLRDEDIDEWSDNNIVVVDEEE